MEILDYLRREFAYNEWANGEVLTAIKAGSADGRSLQLMAHILSAEQLWIERLTQQPQSGPVWPESTVDQCARQIAELGRLWHEYLAKLSAEKLSATIAYKNSKGEPWNNTVVDLLTHVIMHSAYHRGQIATRMREHGQTPAYTDFIHAIRQGKIS